MVSGKGSRSIFSVCEIERRPRGASRVNPLLVCFGPIMPGGFARERLGAHHDIAS